MSKVPALNHLATIEPYIPGDFAVEGVSHTVKLSSNESPMGASEAAVAAYQSAASGLAVYPDSNCSLLRAAIGKRYGLDASRIVCEAGSEQLINIIARAYAAPGNEILFSQYGFIAYRIAALSVGAIPVAAEEKDYCTDVDALLAHVTAKTRVVFVANPNNPTGTRIAFEEIQRLRTNLREDVLLVLDAAYAEYAEEGDYSDGSELVNDEPGNTVVLHTFSKIYGLAALRIGWAYAPQAVVANLNLLRGVFVVSEPAQRAGVAALEDPHHIQRCVEHNVQWRNFVENGLRSAGLTVLPSAGNFVCVRFANQKAADAADLTLRQHGLIPRTLAPYGMHDCLRITVGLEEHCRQVVDLLSA